MFRIEYQFSEVVTKTTSLFLSETQEIMALEEKEIHIIPAGNEFGLCDNNRIYLVYSPLTSKSFLVSKEELPEVSKKLILTENNLEKSSDETQELAALFDEEKRQKYLHHAISPEECLNLTILPNHRCNFNCSYCYSAAGRSKAELTTQQIVELATWAFTQGAKQNHPCRILFLGGGEPLLSWTTVSESICKLEEQSQKTGCQVSYAISTNGSLLTPDKVDFLIKHNVSVQVSFEILEDIQNSQRGHYHIVHENITSALKAGLRLSIHSVVTQSNLERMAEAVQTAHKLYPELKKIGFEPVVEAETFAQPAEAARFYDRFYHNFLAAEKRCASYHMEILTAYSHNMETLRTHYCGGQITLTPHGTFSSCEAISSTKEKGYSESIFGRLNDKGEPEFDMVSFRRLRPAQPGFMRPGCDTCWIKWHCGGGCTLKRRTFTAAIMSEYCRFSRRMMLHFICNKLRKEYLNAANGTDLDELILKTYNR